MLYYIIILLIVDLKSLRASYPEFIGPYAFEGCSSLTSIQLDDSTPFSEY